MRAPSGVRGVISGLLVVTAMVLAVAAPTGAAPRAASTDLSITKVGSPNPVAPGATLTYTITVKNHGPDDAGTVQMRDVIPMSTTFKSITAPSGWSCTTSSGGEDVTVVCTKPTVADGDTATFTLAVTVNSRTPAGTVLSNTATIDSSTSDPDASNNSATETTTVSGQADLTLTKTDSPDPVSAGGDLTYTITVTNKGPDAAASVVVTDTLPGGTTFKSAAPPSGWSCTKPAVGSGGTVTCSTGSMAVSVVATIKLVVKVDATVKAGTVISNTASVSAQTSDPVSGNNSGTAKTTVAVTADLSVSKSANTSPAVAGTPLSFTIEVENLGPNIATTVKMTDAMPLSEAFLSVTAPAGWSCTFSANNGTGTLTCTKAQMLVLEDATFTVKVMVNLAVPGGTTIADTASVSGATVDPVATNNTDTDRVSVVRRADLSITKGGSPDPVKRGHRIFYAITVRSDGPSEAKNAKVVDFIHDHQVFRRVDAPAGWFCSHPSRGHTGRVRCTNPAFDPGDIDVITIVVRVKRSTHAGTLVTNKARVSSPTPDLFRENNHDTKTTRVRRG
jgi:uncharacterized repeat protein (TIGR01451 family)